MTENPVAPEAAARPFRGWRVIFLRLAGFGAGFALMAAILTAAGIWWSNRPKPWSDGSITAKPTQLIMQQTGDELRFDFHYALTNHTNAEYALPSAEMGALMRKLPKDSSFEKMDGAGWDTAIKIPPQQSVGVVFTVPYKFSDFNTSAAEVEPEAKLAEFAGHRLKEIDGLVFFDYASKFKIEMPKNWDAIQRQESGEKRTALIAPDRGDMFDKVAACDQAGKLVERCKLAKVSSDSSPWVKYGGWPEKLRDLPTPPAGYTLDPNAEECAIAAEWRNYCKAKVK